MPVRSRTNPAGVSSVRSRASVGRDGRCPTRRRSRWTLCASVRRWRPLHIATPSSAHVTKQRTKHGSRASTNVDDTPTCTRANMSATYGTISATNSNLLVIHAGQQLSPFCYYSKQIVLDCRKYSLMSNFGISRQFCCRGKSRFRLSIVSV